MGKRTTERQWVLVVEQSHPEVVSLRIPLDELVREDARRMIQSSIDAGLEAFIAQHEDCRDARGR